MKKKLIVSALIVTNLVSFSGLSANAASKTSKMKEISANLNKAHEIISQNKSDDSHSENADTVDINGSVKNYESLPYSIDAQIESQIKRGGNLINKAVAMDNNVLTTFNMENNELMPFNIGIRGTYQEANKEELLHYLDPNNFVGTKEGIMQFLRTNTYREISVTRLNEYLDKYCVDYSKTEQNVFRNKGQAFKDAAKKYNIDPVYFVAHAMWETGYGKSVLSKGQMVDSVGGKPLDKPVKVYNFFGIGAVDGSANLSGKEAAYANGWTSVEATLDGSAKWLSDGYVNSTKYVKQQNSVYKMRWFYEVSWHQYATDVNWACGISSMMSKLIGIYDSNAVLTFDIPQYK
ncbi:MAG: glucosaminidase domain-containing protein [Clostridioides sp.]|jgi:beta-N-acetylglucosaminidase|nr:glucosaminidase domain-containing protein [Clostridioides sp.]